MSTHVCVQYGLHFHIVMSCLHVHVYLASLLFTLPSCISGAHDQFKPPLNLTSITSTSLSLRVGLLFNFFLTCLGVPFFVYYDLTSLAIPSFVHLFLLDGDNAPYCCYCNLEHIPTLSLYFLQIFPSITLNFTENFSPLVSFIFVCFRHRTSSCKD